MLVSPLVGLGSKQSDWVRVARELGIPSVLPVASWDNLTNKGVLKDVPTLTSSGTRPSADEAVAFHGVARPVRVSGAHAFDHWFDRVSGRPREDFLAEVGLPAGPYIVYAGSSEFITGDETGSPASGSPPPTSSHPALRELGVWVDLIRRTPRVWAAFEPPDGGSRSGRGGGFDDREAKRADYFDTLHHSAASSGSTRARSSRRAC